MLPSLWPVHLEASSAGVMELSTTGPLPHAETTAISPHTTVKMLSQALRSSVGDSAAMIEGIVLTQGQRCLMRASVRAQQVSVARRTLVTTAPRQADMVQDMYLKELKAYKPPPEKPGQIVSRLNWNETELISEKVKPSSTSISSLCPSHRHHQKRQTSKTI